MRLHAVALGAMLLSAPLLATTPASAASKPSAQSAHCNALADQDKVSAAQRKAFVAKCLKGPLTPTTPTAPTGTSKESQAITKPSGVDRTTRSKQCAAEADKKRLADKERKAFQLSCLATAGPVSEGETGTKTPKPANQIRGIGENNYKPGAAPPKSTPK